MDKIIQNVKCLPGYQMGNKNFNIVCYADDAVLIARTEDELQRLLHRFVTTAEKFNMEISTNKTKCMCISKNPIRCKLEVNGKIIQQVMDFKYLGIHISSSRRLIDEVRTQVFKASRISGYLRDVIWKNKYLNIESKVKIYKTCVRPIMTYGADTRADTSQTKRLMRTAEMNTLRAIVSKTRFDRVRNQDVRKECNITDVETFITTRKREWSSHVDRADNTRLIKAAKTLRPRGKREVGRPLKRWNET